MGRALTSGEITLARTVFGDTIRYASVRVCHRRYVLFQPSHISMAPNGKIYAVDLYRDDFSGANLRMRAHFIHEMTHVWQKHNRILSPKVAAVRLFIRYRARYGRAYRYTLDPNRDLLSYSMEQQASIIEHYFAGAREPERLAVLRKFLDDPSHGSRTKR